MKKRSCIWFFILFGFGFVSAQSCTYQYSNRVVAYFTAFDEQIARLFPETICMTVFMVNDQKENLGKKLTESQMLRLVNQEVNLWLSSERIDLVFFGKPDLKDFFLSGMMSQRTKKAMSELLFITESTNSEADFVEALIRFSSSRLYLNLNDAEKVQIATLAAIADYTIQQISSILLNEKSWIPECSDWWSCWGKTTLANLMLHIGTKVSDKNTDQLCLLPYISAASEIVRRTGEIVGSID